MSDYAETRRSLYTMLMYLRSKRVKRSGRLLPVAESPKRGISRYINIPHAERGGGGRWRKLLLDLGARFLYASGSGKFRKHHPSKNNEKL